MVEVEVEADVALLDKLGKFHGCLSSKSKFPLDLMVAQASQGLRPITFLQEPKEVRGTC